MRTKAVLVWMVVACGGGPAAVEEPASSTACMWTPIPRGVYLVRYNVEPDYIARDRSELIRMTRSTFKAKIEEVLADSGVRFVEAQGQPASIEIDVVVRNDGSDNLSMQVSTAPHDNRWSRHLIKPHTYTDAVKMIEDNAAELAHSLIGAPRPCPY